MSGSSGTPHHETSWNITLGPLAQATATVIVDTIHRPCSRLGSEYARIGRVWETDVPYAPFGTTQKASRRPAYLIGGPIGEGTNFAGG